MDPSSYPHFVGRSSAMRSVYETLDHVSGTDVTVFVTGESGTGKELVAQAVHDLSNRRRGPFVAVHCGSTPRDLLESELFGHEAGAGPAGDGAYVGAIEQAEGGTLFLDEICEMDVRLQAKMLHFLQEPEFRRLGGTDRVRVDVRIVAATNRDPYEEIKQGRLRDDLYYRLHVVPIHMPPLRDREGDLHELATHFLAGFTRKYDKGFEGFAGVALEKLSRYPWPGNVRELENTIERIVVLNDGQLVTVDMLPRSLDLARPRLERSLQEGGARGGARAGAASDDVILPFTEVEKREIARALRICGWNVAAAAQQLQLGQATVYRKIKKYAIPLGRRTHEPVPR